MTKELFVFLSIVLAVGCFLQRSVSKLFIRYIYQLIPENYFPEKINKVREKAIELMATLFMIALGISPISNLMQFKTPNIQLNSLLFQYTMWYGVLVCVLSYIMAIAIRSLKYLNS